jgi:hypothetical protein
VQVVLILHEVYIEHYEELCTTKHSLKKLNNAQKKTEKANSDKQNAKLEHDKGVTRDAGVGL